MASMKWAGALLVMFPVLYFMSRDVITSQRAEAFERVKNAEQQVIAVMGQPANRETNGGPRLINCASPACNGSCSQHLWYPKPMSLAGEEWAVELGDLGTVINKSHLTSL